MIRRNGTAPAGLARRELGDERAANQAAERALALAEADRLILPFAMTGSAGLLEALPRNQIAYAALLADILDVLHGASPPARQSWLPPAEEIGDPRADVPPCRIARRVLLDDGHARRVRPGQGRG